MLQHVLQPSLKIDEPFAAYTVVTDDGRALLGLIVEQTDQEIVLKTVRNDKSCGSPATNIEEMQQEREVVDARPHSERSDRPGSRRFVRVHSLADRFAITFVTYLRIASLTPRILRHEDHDRFAACLAASICLAAPSEPEFNAVDGWLKPPAGMETIGPRTATWRSVRRRRLRQRPLRPAGWHPGVRRRWQVSAQRARRSERFSRLRHSSRSRPASSSTGHGWADRRSSRCNSTARSC